ncbi:MAG: hypothetical protein P8J93_00675 [SAR86 cluster bacterium]|jgi:type II pantothenate kinase|nr:hypothetical protein [SAR86 cluster bacterium]
MYISIDFGITNTDILLDKEKKLIHAVVPSDGIPNDQFIIDLISEMGTSESTIQGIAVTGGHHQKLSNQVSNIPIFHVNEIEAIGAGGMELSKLNKPAIVVSAGSGTACVLSNNGKYIHCSGTGLGGGTIIGLSKLIINEDNPDKIQHLAENGDHTNTDLILSEVVTGPIGKLPSDSSAVNFGKIGKRNKEISKEDIAAGIINMVSQTITRIVASASISFKVKDIVIVGRTSQFISLRNAFKQAENITNIEVYFPDKGEYASALGALKMMQKKAPV